MRMASRSVKSGKSGMTDNDGMKSKHGRTGWTGKTVRRFMQDDIWNIERNESWFSGMAERGFHLRRIGRTFALFEKGEPTKTKYRIDVINTAPEPEQLELYEEFGWKLVCNIKELYIFSSPENAACPELHTDPAEQSFTLETIDRKLKYQVIWISFLMMIFLSMMAALFFLNQTPTLSLMEVTGLQIPILLFVELYVSYSVIRNYVSLRRLKRTLSEGRPMNHKESWRIPRLINGTISVFFILTAFLTIYLPIAEIFQRENYSLPEKTNDLPVIRLIEIEKSTDLRRQKGPFADGVDFLNSVNKGWSPLAPVQYEINENGVIKDLSWDDDSGPYSPSIETQYYQLLMAGMADNLIRDLEKKFIDSYDPEMTVRREEAEGFDQLIIAESGIRKQVFAARGKEVVYVNYFGNVQSQELIRLLPQAFRIPAAP
ncbi:MAG: hypothetical protein K0R19_2068 [Bacillota bacterium]|nr:hypothetical protein [Bacillota bacterium]